MEYLRLEIFDLPTEEIKNPTTSKFASLEEDASITIIDTSEIFASGDVWSYSFRLNARANAHIMGSVADLHGSRLHDVLDHRRARLWVEGIAIYLGYLRLDDEAEVDKDGNVDVTFESGQKTFDEMIEGAKANQVPMMSDVMIGMALWQKRKVEYHLKMQASATFKDFNGRRVSPSGVGDVLFHVDPNDDIGIFQADGEPEGGAVQQFPRMVFPKGRFRTVPDGGGQEQTEEIDCINTDYPYDDSHPYCNVALCYQKYGYERKMDDGSMVPDYSQEPEAQRGYEVMPANRINSAPNFYVIYWIKALMKHLGIYIEENQMMDVEDLRRLFFVNTKCDYIMPKFLRTVAVNERFGRYTFLRSTQDGIQRLVPEYFGPRIEDTTHGDSYAVQNNNVNMEESKFKTVGDFDVTVTDEQGRPVREGDAPEIDVLKIKVSEVIPWSNGDWRDYRANNGLLHRAIATSDCFPDVDISEVIKAIEDGFGIRLLFSDDYKRVRIVLLRNVFRNTELQELKGDIIGEDEKTENSIRGFRMTYGNSDDTQFYYKGFADKLPHKKPYFVDDSDKHDYSHWNLDADYGDLIQKISAFDKTCSVTPVNGNAYVIKIDKDAKRYEELHPSLFECAGFMDAEDGDCSGEESTIHEVSLNFSPAIMNDVNFENERDNADEKKQVFALFMDATMRPRRYNPDDGQDYNDPTAYYDIYGMLYAKKDGDYVNSNMMADEGVVKPGDFCIRSDAYAEKKNLSTGFTAHVDNPREEGPAHMVYFISNINITGYINEGYRLYLQDNFEPNDDGISAIETKDWGLTLGIMRGSGSNAYVDYSADPDDKEGNDTWEKVAGSSVTSHPDTCDSYGNEWDYNGEIHINDAPDARAALDLLFPDSNAVFYIQGWDKGYINGASVTTGIYDNEGVEHSFLIAKHRGSYDIDFGQNYIQSWLGHSVEEIMAMDAADKCIIIEPDSTWERCDTFLKLCKYGYDPNANVETMVIDNGVGSRYGRFSLKLRAQKPNPYFDATQPESANNRRYLEIDNENLRQRGLCDAFYKEYSYWVRNARVCKRTMRMTLADLLKIDKTKKVKIGDITGFVRKVQYSVSKKTGLGNATFEIMYI